MGVPREAGVFLLLFIVLRDAERIGYITTLPLLSLSYIAGVTHQDISTCITDATSPAIYFSSAINYIFVVQYIFTTTNKIQLPP
ncbi:hypothetical protein Pcinc_037331 [Petrolisthes cinctipes]|uniref:Uncharacterized protein n=1 Tax=Petrolisthes cinctipes TaxID=88211 RepID=A0AAE1BT07_PETCI|nr:hypothetical protein Pcinc_037331 [Petrolisthes cinctipes]